MNTPNVNTFCLARLYDGHEPIKIRVNSISDENPNEINITVYRKNDEDTRDIDVTENGFTFFKEPIDSKLYYIVMSHEEDGYDNTNDYEVQTLMDVEEALSLSEELHKKNQMIEYDVVVKRFK